jgi:hypothetical protein
MRQLGHTARNKQLEWHASDVAIEFPSGAETPLPGAALIVCFRPPFSLRPLSLDRHYRRSCLLCQGYVKILQVLNNDSEARTRCSGGESPISASTSTVENLPRNGSQSSISTR